MDEFLYKPIHVDHEVKNDIFKYEPDKDPVISLKEKLEINAGNKKNKGELISYKIIKRNGWFETENVKSELREAIDAVNEKISTVVKLEYAEIRDTTFNFENSFSEIACKKLEEYFTQIVKNIELFNKI